MDAVQGCRCHRPEEANQFLLIPCSLHSADDDNPGCQVTLGRRLASNHCSVAGHHQGSEERREEGTRPSRSVQILQRERQSRPWAAWIWPPVAGVQPSSGGTRPPSMADMGYTWFGGRAGREGGWKRRGAGGPSTTGGDGGQQMSRGGGSGERSLSVRWPRHDLIVTSVTN